MGFVKEGEIPEWNFRLIRLASEWGAAYSELMATSVSGKYERSKPKLLDEVRAVLRRKHYSLRTEKTDVDWMRRFILFHGKRHPREMGAQEVEAFLTPSGGESRGGGGIAD